MTGIKSKIIAKRDIAKLRAKLTRQHKRIVFTNGVFDIIHYGHISYLQRARALGDILIIGLNTDKSVKKIKGPGRPINKQSDRAGVLAAMECVNYIIYFSEETPLKLIEAVKPDILVKGADYKIKDIVGADFVKSYGGKVKRISLTHGRSTSKLLDKLK